MTIFQNFIILLSSFAVLSNCFTKQVKKGNSSNYNESMPTQFVSLQSISITGIIQANQSFNGEQKNLTYVNYSDYNNPIGNISFDMQNHVVNLQCFNNQDLAQLRVNSQDFLYQVFGSRQFLYQLFLTMQGDNYELVLTSDDYWIQTFLSQVTFNFTSFNKIREYSPNYFLNVTYQDYPYVLRDESSLLNTGQRTSCVKLNLTEVLTGNQLMFDLCTYYLNFPFSKFFNDVQGIPSNQTQAPINKQTDKYQTYNSNGRPKNIKQFIDKNLFDFD